MRTPLIALASFLAISPAMAQETSALPLPVQQPSQGNAFLPAGTEIPLRMADEVTTKGDSWNENDTFVLTVAQDVFHDGYVVIPRGSRAVGRIAWLTSKGAFGKSGKMDVELEYVEVSGRRIDLDGTYRQEGEGNTMATVGGVVLAGVLGGFITGKSARIPRGRELTATLENDLELALPSSGFGRMNRRSSVLRTARAPQQPISSYEELAAMIDRAANAFALNYDLGGQAKVSTFEAEGGALRLNTNIHPDSNPDKVENLICSDMGMQSVLAHGGTVAVSFGGHDLRVTRRSCGA